MTYRVHLNYFSSIGNACHPQKMMFIDMNASDFLSFEVEYLLVTWSFKARDLFEQTLTNCHETMCTVQGKQICIDIDPKKGVFKFVLIVEHLG